MQLASGCMWVWFADSIPGGGGVLTLTWYTYMYHPFGTPFREIWYSDRGVSSETKEPKLHKLGVFWANYCKKHPIWSKLGAFLSKMVYWWVGNLAKNWYRDSQIFEVRQAHPRTILVKEPPPPPGDSIPALVGFLRALRFPPTPKNRNPFIFLVHSFWSLVVCTKPACLPEV